MTTQSSRVRLGAGLTADQVAVRRHNLSLVLRHLRVHGDRSRARIAADVGLNKATVSSLVAELAARGLVVEGETERGGVGRPGRVVEIAATTLVAVGAEVNTDYVSVLVTNLRGEAVAERRVALDTAAMAATDVLSRLAALCRTVLDPVVREGSDVVGLTLALPGIVAPATGTVDDAPNLGWRGTPVVDVLRTALGDPVYPIDLDNEANLSALAELEVRHPETARELILITGAVGVGGGVVTSGRLLRGGRGFAGELGHMHFEPDGRRCRCGRRGCWETVVGLGALLRAAAPASDPVRDPSVDVVQRLQQVRARAEQRQARTLRAIEQVGDALVRGCGTLVNLFNPEVLVLGGYFAELGPWFLPRLQAELAGEVFAPHAGGCRVELSTLGFSAAVRGGALRSTRRVYDDPTVVPLRPAADEMRGASS
ncbi:ROK family transcriptional regulator [Phycicoccus flavus]|uniref:ROK family transcriptional regulator n=1 Tax=Phycicoccus flavus TaxID=2502783 RepID=UPI000FEC1A03|nr:ROK family transcriptional regulator [Phycicoccus flavus]NHA69945.1 ROK family transcriptional regulator [Phycicoccus flavus]